MNIIKANEFLIIRGIYERYLIYNVSPGSHYKVICS
jgi:hypothetical protein